MTPEGKVKAAVKKILTEAGAWYCTPLGAGYGRAGVECKAGKGKTTALQDRELAAIGGAGGHTFVIREDGLGYLKTMLKDCV